MAILKDIKKHIKIFASESLDAFKKISDSAKAHLNKLSSSSGAGVFGAINTLNDTEAVKKQQENHNINVESSTELSQEPAIARVIVININENDEQNTYYICRTMPISFPNLASYRSHNGRLASLPVGEEYEILVDGQLKLVEIIETAKYHPVLDEKGWDSLNTIFEVDGHGPVTIESLRALLDRDPKKIHSTQLEELLNQERDAEIVKQGIHRNVIKKMDLRDQPTLDRYQDEIFRLPLDSRLLILGAPGTGKTTTLIKRLGQKLDVEFLNEYEKQMINTKASGTEAFYAQSWIMFTPTELLRLYVKEAFNREDIPASDERISTWTDFRRKLARDQFRILRTASKKSSFVMKDSLQILNVNSEENSIEWFSDFDQWQKSVFWEEMRVSAEKLSKNPRVEAAQLGTKFLDALNSAGSEVNPSIFGKLMHVADEIQKLVREMKASSDNEIRSALNLQFNKDNRFLDDLADFVEKLSKPTNNPEDQDVEDDAEDQDIDIEDDEATNQPPRGRNGAAEAHYMRAVRTHARAQVKNQKISKSNQNGLLIEWLGDRSLPDQELKEVGKALITQSLLRHLVNPVRRYIDGIPVRYRRFRRERQAENKWYQAKGFGPKDIHPLEIDLLLLTMIRSTDDLIKSAPTLGHDDSRAKAILERLQNLYRTQVLVDEATDFSPIQLSCMVALARPGIQSFFACGDFNQRLTRWGTNSSKQMEWAIPSIKTQNISKAYRQSSQLHALANKIANLSDGEITDNVKLAEYAENEGVPPVLATQMNEVPIIADWLADRIEEVERFLDELPSIAVLVNTEEEVGPLAKALGDALTNQNINVTACTEGKSRGQDDAVRVFDVQHIKGLEFEAVFFVGLDKLAETHPTLFNKYLYVGATRAATYLGITCEQELPSRMTKLKESFEDKW